MKKYEAPILELLSIGRDIITTSGLGVDLSTTFDAVGADMFSVLEIG